MAKKAKINQASTLESLIIYALIILLIIGSSWVLFKYVENKNVPPALSADELQVSEEKAE
jgi:hypothetical protein